MLFTERLGLVVSMEDLGYGHLAKRNRHIPGDGLSWPAAQAVSILTEFTGMDLMLNRRGVVGSSSLSTRSGSAVEPLLPPLLRPRRAEEPGPAPGFCLMCGESPRSGSLLDLPVAGTAGLVVPPSRGRHERCLVCGKPSEEVLLRIFSARGGGCRACARGLGHAARRADGT
ncbi:hypothetical protein [Streptomyces hiroshimensis]|uniref:hypothetical protein n=1 Tax=Streptomyces hiroshimensis TaxID=66424 RepID=UPI00167AF5C1|nr:hypothetical protein [Streptomyces hiroshimensis]